MNEKNFEVVALVDSPLRKNLIKRYSPKSWRVSFVKNLNIQNNFNILIVEDKLIDKLLKAKLTHKPEIMIIGKRVSEENLKKLKLKGFKYMLVSLTGTEIDNVFKRAGKLPTQPKLSPENSSPINPSYKIVLVGASTGGPGLIERLVRNLPADYPNPVVVVQHMPKGFTTRFAERLNSVSLLEVIEAENGVEIKPGRVVIAKAGYHLKFSVENGGLICLTVPNDKGLFFVPSVDETFFSALETVNPKKIVAVLLTGIGDDGAEGMVALKRAGAYTIAESEESAAVYGMPKEAALRGGACKVLHFDDILKEIISIR